MLLGLSDTVRPNLALLLDRAGHERTVVPVGRTRLRPVGGRRRCASQAPGGPVPRAAAVRVPLGAASGTA